MLNSRDELANPAISQADLEYGMRFAYLKPAGCSPGWATSDRRQYADGSVEM